MLMTYKVVFMSRLAVGCERNNVQAVCECPESIRDGVVSKEQ